MPIYLYPSMVLLYLIPLCGCKKSYRRGCFTRWLYCSDIEMIIKKWDLFWIITMTSTPKGIVPYKAVTNMIGAEKQNLISGN